MTGSYQRADVEVLQAILEETDSFCVKLAILLIRPSFEYRGVMP